MFPENGRVNRYKLLGLILLIAIVVGFFLIRWIWFGHTEVASNVTFTVTRGDLTVTILEGGSIEARDSLEIKSEVQGETKILSIVEEGYFVTSDDVRNGKVLVELDKKRLLDQQTEQELRFQNAKASLADAQEQYEIQKNQNEIDIRQAELAVKFARMDLEKFLGVQATKEILDQIGVSEEQIRELLEEQEKAESKETMVEEMQQTKTPNAVNELNGNTELEANNLVSGSDAQNNMIDPATTLINSITTGKVDFKKYADPSKLGDGEAQQQLQKYMTDRILAEEEVKLAQKKLDGTRRLFEKAFVTQTDLETDELTLKRKQILLEQTNTGNSLYIQYEFPKQAERLLAAYIESVWKLFRIQKVARSRLAQAEAKLNSAKAQFALESRKKREIEEQIEKCTIRATKPGLVVYGGGEDRFMQERIQEGTTVRERQIIITIPDTSVMRVRAKVHESNIKKVKPGQKARIRVDAFPEEILTGVIEKVAVLPNAQNRWLNPDLKVYDTFIVIEGTHPWLKPGMTAQVEIISAELKDVLYVPLQCVVSVDGQQVCYVQQGDKIEMRAVKTGEFNESFIEIKEGLKEGETVLLYLPKNINMGNEKKRGLQGEVT